MTQFSNVISATTVQCKTMADGTLRIAVDIEPMDARAAFDLFGPPGQIVAMAAIRPKHAPASPSKNRTPTEAQAANWEALGQKTKAAISIGASPDFWEFSGTANATEAGEYIKKLCGVSSRNELNEPGEAQDTFNRLLANYRAFTERRYGATGQDEYESP